MKFKIQGPKQNLVLGNKIEKLYMKYRGVCGIIGKLVVILEFIEICDLNNFFTLSDIIIQTYYRLDILWLGGGIFGSLFL